MTKRLAGRVSAALLAAPLALQGGGALAAGTTPGTILDLGQVFAAAEGGAAAGSAGGSAAGGVAAGGAAAGGTAVAGGLTLGVAAAAGTAVVAGVVAAAVAAGDSDSTTGTGTTNPNPSGSDGTQDPDTDQDESPGGTGDEDNPLGFAAGAATQALPTGSLGNGVFLAHGYDPRFSFGVLAGGKVSHADLLDSEVLANPFIGSTGRATMTLVSASLAPTTELRAGNWMGGGEAGFASEVTFEQNGRWGVRFGGASQKDAFGIQASARSMFAGVSYELDVSPQLALVASAHYGVSGIDFHLQGRDARLSGDVYGIGLVGRDVLTARDRVGLIVGQPLQFTGGAEYDLREGRNMEVQGFYARDLADDQQMRFGAAWLDGEDGGFSVGAHYVVSFGLTK